MNSYWFNNKRCKNKKNILLIIVVFIFWFLLLATTIFYLRSAIVRINEEVLYNLSFDTQEMNLRDLIKKLLPGLQNSFPNINIIMPTTIDQEYKITKTFYAPWMYSEMGFAILLLIFSILMFVGIILYLFNFNFEKFIKSNLSTYILGFLTLLCLVCGVLGIMTFVQKTQYWNMFSSNAIKISNWVNYVYDDLFVQLKQAKGPFNKTLISILDNAIKEMIPDTILIVSKQTFVDVYSYSIGALILGILSIIMITILYPLFVIFKNKYKTYENQIYKYKWIIIFFTILVSIFMLFSSGFYLTNFIKDVTSEASPGKIDIWNTATAYTVSSLLVSLLLIFFTLLINLFTFTTIRNNTKLMLLF